MVLRINFFGTTDLCLDIDHLSCKKNWTHTSSTSGSYGRLAYKTQVKFENFKISTY